MEKQSYVKIGYFRTLWSFIKPYKARFFLATFLRVTGDIVNLYPAYALARVVNLLSENTDTEELRRELALLLLVWLFTAVYKSIGKQGAKYLGYQVAEQVGLDAYKQTVTHIHDLDMAWQEKENSGNKMKRINNGSMGLRNTLRIYISNILEGIINTVGIAILLTTQGLLVGGSLSIFIIVFYILSLKLTRRAVKQVKIVKEQEEDLEGLAFESVNNIQTIKALSLNETMDSQITGFVNRLFLEIRKRIYLFQTRSFVMGVLYTMYSVGMIALLTYFVLEGRYEVGFIVLYYSYLQKVTVAIWELSDVTQELIVFRVWIFRMMAILSLEPSIEVDQENQEEYSDDWKELKLENISFSYGDRQNIEDLDLTVKRGEKVGIVGLSGAGKSTLFKLLLDLYEDYSGSIKIGDKDLKDLSRQSYISNVSVVLQDTELFNASLEENIKLAGVAHKEVSEKELGDIYKTSYLNELLGKLPHGKDTVVGEKGVKLSGGERQRVGIARALYRKPDILLLDEATSHLDAESEKKIQSALETFFDKVTAIVIAHRLSTLKNMDRIIVMDEGKIVEEGTFEELMQKGDHFTKLWEMQRI
ncbi:ATP-binding cassette domain-containing protein [Candidatus Dojkabacteria bacterium]|nr:ATP-binding cassette domain-containing protein [Candidatus Dojkabacteria bacterium]